MFKKFSKKIVLIAEVKTKSPFGFLSELTWIELFNMAILSGDIISIHTDSRWGGSLDLVRKALSLTRKPILAKGIHANDNEIIEILSLGVEYILVVGRVPNISKTLLEKCLIEPTSLENLRNILRKLEDLNVTKKIVWNSRNLGDGSLKHETWEDARELHTGWMCQASNIRSIEDVKKDANAVLIGQHLQGFIDTVYMIE